MASQETTTDILIPVSGVTRYTISDNLLYVGIDIGKKSRVAGFISQTLLDQDIFAGVGNMIKKEVLSIMKINPKKRVGKIDKKTLTELIRVTKDFSMQFYTWRKEFTLRKHLKIHRKKNSVRIVELKLSEKKQGEDSDGVTTALPASHNFAILQQMTVLILHGIYGHAGIHWQQWLYDELVEKGYAVFMPALPKPGHPDRKVWLETLTTLLKNENPEDVIIVGHSLGVASALDYLETIEKPIQKLISVSGFGEDYGSELNSFFMKEKEIDFQKVRKHVQKCIVIYGDDDPYVPQETLALLAKKLTTEPVIIHHGGHLNAETGYTSFPFVLASIVAT